MKIGIIGDGQLARMTIEASSDQTSFNILCLKSIEESICGSFNNSKVQLYDMSSKEDIHKFEKESDIITYEFEDIDLEMIKKFNQNKNVFPRPFILETIQSKIKQKEFLKDNQLPTADFRTFYTFQDYLKIHDQLKIKNPLGTHVIKLDRGGYNGLGVMIIAPETSLATIKEFIGNNPGLVEDKINLKNEYGIIAIKQNDQIYTYDPVEMVFNSNNTLNYYFYDLGDENNLDIPGQIKKISKKLLNVLDSDGVYGIEFFESLDEQILINEISPRTHNSGHHTIETYTSSQFKDVNKIALGIQIDQPRLNQNIKKNFYMFNLLGSNFTGQYQIDQTVLKELKNKYQVYLHDYGKIYNKPNRKIGHLTFIDLDPDQINNVKTLINSLIIPKI